MARRLAIFIFVLLTQQVFAEALFTVAGQEGDERFFPLLSSIYRQLGIEVSYKILPSARALSLVDDGVYEAEAGRIQEISEGYQNLRFSKEPLITVELVGLVRKDSKLRLTSVADLANYRVGYVIGMSTAEYFTKQSSLKAISVATHDQLAKMLSSDRIDVALMGTAFSSSPVFAAGDVRLRISTFAVYHVLNKKYASLIPQFDDVLKEMKKDGRYTVLLPLRQNR
jgi:ABC-type amino acid transport substrate-binding protein